jgi:hypothetical protein
MSCAAANSQQQEFFLNKKGKKLWHSKKKEITLHP